MGDSTLQLISDFLDSAEYTRLKAPNSIFYTDDTNKLQSDSFLD